MATKMGAFMNVLLAFSVVFLALYIELPKYREDPESEDLLTSDPAVRAAFLSDKVATAKHSMDHFGSYVWGRTTTPAFSFDIHPLNPVQFYTEMKQFVWMSVTSGPWLVGFAIMQLQYADILVFQVFRQDAEKGTTSLKGKVTIPLLSPLLKWGTEWSPNATGSVGPRAIGHRVQYHAPPWAPTAHCAITFTEDAIEFNVQATLVGEFNGAVDTTATVHLTGRMAKPTHLMGLVFPLGPHRPSLVNKMAAVPLVPSSTILTIGRKGSSEDLHRWELTDGLAAMDYTRGLLRRHTQWYWACVSDPHSGLGLHLSHGAYDMDDVSMEATLYDARSGTVSFLNEVISFQRADGGTPRDWVILSDSISLRFTPHEGHNGRVNLKFVDVNMDHQWGTFTGTVKREDGTTVSLTAAPGVFENHDALW